LNEIRSNLYVNPQKCIQILSSPALLNNIFQYHLEQLTQILESNLTKMNKENKNISFAHEKGLQ
jgi:hypothetical protein